MEGWTARWEPSLTGVKLPFPTDPGPGWAVAVGTSSLRLVRARIQADPVRSFRVEVARDASIPGPDHPGRLETLRQKLGELMAAGSGSNPRRILLSLPGNEAVVRRTSLPTDDPERTAELVSYEAVRELSAEPDQVIVDHQVLSGGENTTDLLLVAVRQTTLTSYERVLRERGCFPRVIETAPVSLYNLYRFTRPNLRSENPTVAKALVHVEADGAELVLVKGEQFLGARSLLLPESPTDPPDRSVPVPPPEDPELVKRRPPEGSKPATGPQHAERPDVKTPWEREVLLKKVERAFRILRGESPPHEVGEILLSGRPNLVRGAESVLGPNLDLPTTPLNPVSRVEGPGPGDVPEMLVCLGLSLRSSDETADLRLHLGSSNPRNHPGGSPGIPTRYVVAGLTVLLFIQFAAAAYVRGRDQRQRLVRTRRAVNLLQPHLRRMDRMENRVRRWRVRLGRVRRARSLNRGILELLDRLNRVPPALRATTRFRRFWLKSGENRRLYLRGTTGSHGQLGRLYRWLLGIDAVIEILRENQSTRSLSQGTGGPNRLRFEVTLAVDLLPESGRGAGAES